MRKNIKPVTSMSSKKRTSRLFPMLASLLISSFSALASAQESCTIGSKSFSGKEASLSNIVVQNSGDRAILSYAVELNFDRRISSASLSGDAASYKQSGYRRMLVTPKEPALAPNDAMSFGADVTMTRRVNDSTKAGCRVEVLEYGEPAQPQPLRLVYAINAGGGDYTMGQSGLTFKADAYVNGGSTSPGRGARSPIENTADDALYQSQRWGAFQYELPVTNGSYNVTLKLSENHFINAGDEGRRVFSVSVEGQTAFSDLDLVSEVGALKAHDIGVQDVSVRDGSISISGSASVNNATIAAIIVRSRDGGIPGPNPSATPIPTSSPTPNPTILPVAGQPWSRGNTWPNGRVPTNGSNVNIAAGKIVVLDADIEVGNLIIDGTLRCANKDIELSAKNIMVHGVLECGTAEEPYNNQLQIVLRGNANDPELMGMGSKVLGVMGGGTLSIHGQERVSWTQLGATAEVGATSITLSRASDWRVGERIVIASTDYDPDEAEVRVITSVSPNGRVVSFSEPLRYMHYGKIESYNNGAHQLDMRAEVGLLSRNIKIYGDTSSGNTGFGGHMMFMADTDVKISGVELHRLGQKQLLGRYPVHWHLAGDAQGSYFKNSAVWRSFNRAVTVHSSNNTLIENNVAYDHIGHGYFLETGDEEGNVFRSNLGLGTRRPGEGEHIRSHDRSPATFWITNPNNTWEGNAAAGSDSKGFWIVPVSTPLRDQYWGDFSPRKMPIKSFKNNRAHSNPRFNFGIDNDVKLVFNPNKTAIIDEVIETDFSYSPRDASGNRVDTIIEGLTSFKSREQAYWTRMNGANYCRGCALAESKEQTFISFHGAIEDSLIVGKSNNTGTINPRDRAQVAAGRSLPKGNEFLGLLIYNGSNDVRNTHIAGFYGRNAAIFGTRRSSGKHPNATVTGLSFDADTPLEERVKFDGDGIFSPLRGYNHVTGLIDLDGSLSGTPGVRLTPHIKAPNNPSTYRVYDEDFNVASDALVNGLPQAWNARGTIGVDYGMLMVVAGFGGKERDFAHIISGNGAAVHDVLRTNRDSQTSVVLNRSDYRYSYQWNHFPNSFGPSLLGASRGDKVLVSWVNIPSSARAGSTRSSVRRANSWEDLLASDKTAYFIDSNTFHVKFVATDNLDGDGKSSTEFVDYGLRPNSIKIVTQNGPGNGRLEYGVIADFDLGDDRRDSLAGSASRSNLAYQNGRVEWTINNDGDGVDEFVDYTLTFPRQVWNRSPKLSINASGPKFRVLVQEPGSGKKSLGDFTPRANGFVDIDLGAISDPKDKDHVTSLTIRVYESSVGNINSRSSAKISIDEIRLYGEDVK